jgi:hypothetical protein
LRELTEVHVLSAGLGSVGMQFDTRPSLEREYELLIGRAPLEPGVTLRRVAGTKEVDLALTRDGFLYLMSARFRSVLSEEGFTGWHGCPVRTVDGRGNDLGDYALLTVSGHSGPIDKKAAPVIWRMPDKKFAAHRVRIGLPFRGEFVGPKRPVHPRRLRADSLHRSRQNRD